MPSVHLFKLAQDLEVVLVYRVTAGIIGSSDSLKKLMNQVERIAPTSATVLLQGETGVGKELIARQLHELGNRSGDFVTVSLAAIPENLIEAELFGVEKGAYTSASASRIGLLQRAEGGTIFLDEIGEISPRVQVKLLRVLQERQVSRLGSADYTAINVRVIAATNKDLAKAVREGTFREDLYYRLKVLPLEIPPLRQRIDDLPELIEHFAAQSSLEQKIHLKFSQAALSALAAYSWPGNIRELRALIDNLTYSVEGGWVSLRDLPDPIKFAASSGGVSRELASSTSVGNSQNNTLDQLLAEYEQGLIQQALELHAGSIQAAAHFLGVKRTTLYDKVKRFGIRVQAE